MLTPARVSTRAKWLCEEVGELVDVTSLVEQVDAVVDLIYIAIGCLVEMGVGLEGSSDHVHRTNLAKRWSDGTIHFDEDGKVLKPPGWSGPEEAIQRLLQGLAKTTTRPG